MPLYEYRCKACAHLEEVLQKVSDPAPALCPACGGAETLEKEVSLTSFQLKGGGWYKDLYGSVPSDKKTADTKSSSGSSSSSSSDSSTGSSSSSSPSSSTASTGSASSSTSTTSTAKASTAAA